MALLCLSIIDKPLLCSSIVQCDMPLLCSSVADMWLEQITRPPEAHTCYFLLSVFSSRFRFYPLAQFSFLHLNLWSWFTNMWFLVHGAHHFLLLIYNIILSFCFDRLRMVTCYAHLNVVQLWCTGILDSFFSFLFLFLTISIVYRVEIHIRSPLG